MADRGDGQVVRIRLTIDGGTVVLREHYRHRTWTLPLNRAVSILFRQAQVRYSRIRLGTHPEEA